MADKYISGFKELDALLKQLPQTVENKVLQKATREGGKVLLNAAREAAPKGMGKQSPKSRRYGRLVKNTKLKVLRRGKSKGRRGIRVHTGDAFWGRIIEFGSRYTKAKPWFRPAIEENADAAFEAVKKELAAGIEREAKKLAAKYRVK